MLRMPTDRRRFLYGTGIALALPHLETFAEQRAGSSRHRFAAFYMPDGVPMPLAEDPAYEDWAWFPIGKGRDFQWTRCLDPLEPLRDEVTIISGMSHTAVRNIHGHRNADQFLTAANTGDRGGYHNTVSLDQEMAFHRGDQTRYGSLVISTDGGTGTPRGAHTMSFDRNGRAIPAEHRPKQIFDMLFVRGSGNASRKLALAESALDDLLEDARSLRRRLSQSDRGSLDEYLQSIRDAERKVLKARRWADIPLPQVNVDHLNLDITPDDPQNYLRTMFELIYLAFRTDVTRIATYQIGRENGIGKSDYLARAVGFNLTHQLSHETAKPDGWKNFGTYCRFLTQEFGRLAQRLKDTPEPAGQGNMLDHTVLLFGSASSAFHLSRNYPLILAGGRAMGYQHGQYLNFAGEKAHRGAWDGRTEPWQKEAQQDDLPLANLFVTMLQRFGIQTDTFADSTGGLDVV